MMNLKQQIMKMALEAVSAASPVELITATVISAPPNLSIKLKDNDKLVIPKEMIYVSEFLTRHERTIRVNGGTSEIYEFIDELKIGDKVMVASFQGGQSFYIFDRFKNY